MREMSEKLLSIRNLHASVEGQSILNGIDLDINPGEVHVLMGPNGAGKSTLANVILGDPRYEVTEGSIFFEGADITEEKTDAREASKSKEIRCRLNEIVDIANERAPLENGA